ncbi:MAG: hypothetical protein WCT12_12150 [Verrucomicrobiota bacterium]
MKRIIPTILAGSALTTGHAQWLIAPALNGALLGSYASPAQPVPSSPPRPLAAPALQPGPTHYWTTPDSAPAYQIPDALRVPDASTF